MLDAYSRRVVGWSMAKHLRTELVLDALNVAIHNSRPAAGLVHHSDRGSQYTSVEFGGRLKEAGLLPSMGSVADAYDNALRSPRAPAGRKPRTSQPTLRTTGSSRAIPITGTLEA